MKIISLILSLLTLLAAAYFHNISGNGIPGNIINIASAARQAAGELSPVNTGEVSLPVIMYHSVLKDPARTGEYVVTPETLENFPFGDITAEETDGTAAVTSWTPLPMPEGV